MIFLDEDLTVCQPEVMEESLSRPQEGLVNQVSPESANKMRVDEDSVIVKKDEGAPVEKIQDEVSVAGEIPKDGEACTQPLILQQNESENECQNGLGDAERDSVFTEKISGQDTVKNKDGDAQKISGDSLNPSPFSESHPRSPGPESETLCTDNEKSSCGSPTVIKATIDLSQADSEKERAKGSTNQNIPVAASNGNDSSNFVAISQDLRRDDAFKIGDSFTFEVKSLGDSSMKEAATNSQPFNTMRACNLSPRTLKEFKNGCLTGKEDERR